MKRNLLEKINNEFIDLHLSSLLIYKLLFFSAAVSASIKFDAIKLVNGYFPYLPIVVLAGFAAVLFSEFVTATLSVLAVNALILISTGGYVWQDALFLTAGLWIVSDIMISAAATIWDRFGKPPPPNARQDGNSILIDRVFSRPIRKGNPEVRSTKLQLKEDAPLKIRAIFSAESDGVNLRITESKTDEEAQIMIDLRHIINVKYAAVVFWEYDLINQNVYLSSECQRQIGYSLQDLQHCREKWETRLHPNDREKVTRIIRQCIATQTEGFELEYRLRHKNKSYLWIYTRGALLYDVKGQPCRLTGMNLDITSNKNMQAVNERRQRIDEFYPQQIALQTVAALAHEINQPLMAVASYLEIALHIIEENDVPDFDNLLTVLNKSSEQLMRAGRVIRQLMNMLQKDEPISESVVLESVVHEACEIIRTESNLGDIKLELYLAPNLPPVKANALQIEKVVVNLLRNGVDAMREGALHAGTITLTTGIYPGDPAMAQVTVRDSGKGVEPDILRIIFQPFFSTKTKGLGMGLAISRALIEAHNGKLWAENNPGSGLSFHFTLPFMS